MIDKQEKNDSLSMPVHDHILKLIFDGALAPGDKIPEAKIAKSLGVSRTPIRDALKRLENEGLVEIYPNRYAQVAVFTPQIICDVATTRIALEQMAVKLAIFYGSKADFLHLREIAETCATALEQNDWDLRRSADCDFHLQIARISGNHLLIKFQQELYLRVQFIMLTQRDLINDEQRHIQHHFDIVAAMMDGDEKRAVQAVQDHLVSFYNLRTRVPVF